MTVYQLRTIGNEAELLGKTFAGKKGSYSVGEDEAEMIRHLCRFVLSFDYMYVQLKSDEIHDEPRLVIGA